MASPVNVQNMYRLPKKKKVPRVIYNVCRYIFAQNIQVSDLNKKYTGHCVPRDKKYRGHLRRKYGAKFGRYYQEQDNMILSRFEELVTQGIVQDIQIFCRLLGVHCNGKDQKKLYKSQRNIDVRNVIGLFVGQDMPEKLAAVHCLRLIKLVLGSSYLFRRRQPVEQATPARRKKASTWSIRDEKSLIEWVVAAGANAVHDPTMVDWEGAGEWLGRDEEAVRVHWIKVLHPTLMCDANPLSVMEYRKRLLKEVIKRKPGNIKDIDWVHLSAKFSPRSSTAIQSTLRDLIRTGRQSMSGETSREFRRRLKMALSRVIRILALPEKKIGKFVKKTAHKKELQEYYQKLVN